MSRLGSITSRRYEEPARGGELLALRLEAARNVSAWTELAESVLVERGPYLVHAETDELWRRYRGDVFATAKASPSFATDAPLAFYLDSSGALHFLERVRSPRTWSEIVAKRTTRAAARAAG